MSNDFDEWFDREGISEEHRHMFGVVWDAATLAAINEMSSQAGVDIIRPMQFKDGKPVTHQDK